MSAPARRQRTQAPRREESYDILDAHEATGTAGARVIHVHYDVRFTDFDLDDPRLPADILTNWIDYQFVKIFRGERYVRCEIRRRDPAQHPQLWLCEVRYARQVGMTRHSTTGCRDEAQAEAFRCEALRTARRVGVGVSVWIVRGTFRERGGQVVSQLIYAPRRGRRGSRIRRRP